MSYLQRIHAQAQTTISMETNIAGVSFSFDAGTASFFAKRGLPAATEVDSTNIKGKLKWQLAMFPSDTGIEVLSASMEGEQKITLQVTYYVGEVGEDTETITEEILIKNVKVDMESSRSLSTHKNKLILNLHIDEILWDEDSTVIKVRAGA